MGALKVTIEGDFDDVMAFFARDGHTGAKKPDSDASKEKNFEKLLDKMNVIMVLEDSGAPRWEYK